MHAFIVFFYNHLIEWEWFKYFRSLCLFHLILVRVVIQILHFKTFVILSQCEW